MDETYTSVAVFGSGTLEMGSRELNALLNDKVPESLGRVYRPIERIEPSSPGSSPFSEQTGHR